MTSVRPPDLTVRSYRSVSWCTSTAVTVSGWSLPVLVSVARTLSPGLREEIGAVLPPGSRTRVSPVKDWPPLAVP
jgi:hypothetical protein